MNERRNHLVAVKKFIMIGQLSLVESMIDKIDLQSEGPELLAVSNFGVTLTFSMRF